MSDGQAIRLERVSKMYRLFTTPGQRLREALDPWRRCFHVPFWALRDISLEVPRGTTLGVLGLNGSGKSTLLQIVADVLQPTTGIVEVNGRVAALLELGAGFDPELTGRENVLTNALILGLSRREALARLERVRDFADIGAFFDRPVKTYSSGMFMRLAFAMAITVEPDILIVDEALAVGDTRFQEKCFRRLKEFQAGGGTVLFVTHDRASVTHLCDRAILLHQGRLVADGEPERVVAIYSHLLTVGELPNDAAAEATVTDPRPSPVSLDASDNAEANDDGLEGNPLYNAYEVRFGHGGARILDAVVVWDGEKNPAAVPSGSTVDIFVRIRFDKRMEPLVGFTLHNAQGVVLYGTHSGWLGATLRQSQPGELRWVRFTVTLPLAPGTIFIELAVAENDGTICDQRSRALALEILRRTPFLGLADLRAKITEPASVNSA